MNKTLDIRVIEGEDPKKASDGLMPGLSYEHNTFS